MGRLRIAIDYNEQWGQGYECFYGTRVHKQEFWGRKKEKGKNKIREVMICELLLLIVQEIIRSKYMVLNNKLLNYQ